MLYEILRDFPGSQDGSVTEQFIAGTRRELSDYLAAIVVPPGWARPVQDEKPADAAREDAGIDASPDTTAPSGDAQDAKPQPRRQRTR